MGESKSPALPLGDGAPVRISIVEFLSFVKQKRFAVSVYSIKFLMGYIRKHDFKFFGYYRIVLGIIVLSYFGISALVA